MAVVGRSVTGWTLSDATDRRIVSVANYGLQTIGSFLVALGGHYPLLLVIGMLLFGWGVGNANLLPPLIAQAEFAPEDVPRVVALITAISQTVYAFAPGLFGSIRSFAGLGGWFSSEAAFVGFAAVAIQLAACAAFLFGRGEHLFRQLHTRDDA